MPIKTDALIIRENNRIGENDRLITALTRERGVLQASVRGARKITSRSGSGTSLLTYSTLTLTEGKNKWIVTDAKPQRVFFELRSEMSKVALAQYFCELAGVLAPREEPAEEALRLLLNALHFLSEGSREAALLKVTVEQRLLRLAGYCPDLSGCAVCGRPEGGMFLQPLRGTLLCTDHGSPSMDTLPLTAGAVAAWRYLTAAPEDKLFSVKLSEESLQSLVAASEYFLLSCLGRGFNTLDFYHSVK